MDIDGHWTHSSESCNDEHGPELEMSDLDEEPMSLDRLPRNGEPGPSLASDSTDATDTTNATSVFPAINYSFRDGNFDWRSESDVQDAIEPNPLYPYQDPDPPLVPRYNDNRATTNLMPLLSQWAEACGFKPPISPRCSNERPEVVGVTAQGDFQNMYWDQYPPGARDHFCGFLRLSEVRQGHAFAMGNPSLVIKNPYRFFKTMTQAISKIEHFQLRNLLVTTTALDAFYANGSKVMHVNVWDPIGSAEKPDMIMDITDKHSTIGYDPHRRISTLANSEDCNVLFAGDFRGSLNYRVLHDYDSPIYRMDVGAKPVNFIDPSHNQMTAFVATNDGMLSTVDYSRMEVVKRAYLVYDTCSVVYRTLRSGSSGMPLAVNCTSTSADGRVRLLVGDFAEMIVTDARIRDSGSGIIHTANMCDDPKCDETSPTRCANHFSNASFAVSWNPYDPFSIATGSDNGLVRLWDARMWKTAVKWQANAPICNLTFGSTRKFWELGSNGPVLYAAEPAGRVHAFHADALAHVGELSFMGDVGGVAAGDYDEAVMVLNSDRDYGGLMIWEHAESKRRGGGDSWNRFTGLDFV